MVSAATRHVFSWCTRMQVRWSGVACDSSVTFLGQPIIALAPGGSISIGPQTTLISRSKYTALAVAHPVVLRLLRSGAKISIGAHVGLSGTSICSAMCVSIGDECLIGADVVITDTDFHALEPQGRRYERRPERIGAAPVHIGNNVFIGARAIILKGVSIGDNSVIGAGSVVTSDVPGGVIAAGNPCRVIRSL